jgi:hypothetical protein
LVQINSYCRDRADKLAKWAGLTPSVYQSANVTKTGSIPEQGSRHIRGFLVKLAHVALRSTGRFKAFFERLMSKKGDRKAFIAVAPKMLRIDRTRCSRMKFPDSSRSDSLKMPGKMLASAGSLNCCRELRKWLAGIRIERISG